VAGQKMFDEGVDSAVTFAAQFGVFRNRKVPRSADFLRLQQGCRCLGPAAVELRATDLFRHVKHCKDRACYGNGTVVLSAVPRDFRPSFARER